MSDDREVQKLLRETLAGMPVTIESRLSDPNASATSKLRWVKLALRVFRGPVGRPATGLDLKNKRKDARTLREAVPALQKIRDEHTSAGLRKTAAKYLRYIESEVASGN
jgi:tRNA threonylcarbamoyladenosine modification (KEOPS) complex  Pcc1 subunit